MWPSKRYGRRAFLGGAASAVIGLPPLTAYGEERKKEGSPKSMDEIQGIGRLKIHDGKLEEFKRVASQFVQVVRVKDPGTLQYELYLNEASGEACGKATPELSKALKGSPVRLFSPYQAL